MSLSPQPEARFHPSQPDVGIEDAKQLLGASQARSRHKRAVPFALTCQTLTVAGNATAGYHPAAADHRQHAPGYTTKTHSPTADMFHKIRRVLITVKYQAVHPGQTTPAELHTLRPTWEIAAT
ncbi:hypothetical protein [Frankia sp. ACN1ag]|uniref:hypothetical protein n=1 Tax=Frankia sp. ACN1ag TaxID=102891 RepID=UPI0006DC1541|nr:hypothetical protein [Frankia sp. ACN1ag]KQC37681.1 hypothetical protein UK82_13620 [Frankia sp. ACN1ag]